MNPKPIPVALQLYTLRDAFERNVEEISREVAAMGYIGVETYDFPAAISVDSVGRLFRELELTVAGAHMPLPLGDQKNRVLETAAALGCKQIISASVGSGYYQDADGIKRACDLLNEANAVAAAQGFSYGVHNHHWEFMPVEGRYPYEIWLEELDPDIFFELDTYWIQSAGLDPADVVKRFGSRASMLHIKDGTDPADTKSPMVAVGSGIVDIPSVVEAGREHAKWLVVELDRCATDMLTAVRQSFSYLIEEGLGYGK